MNPIAVANKGMNLLFQGHIQQASIISEQLLVDAAEVAPVHYFASEVALAKRQPDEALSHINHAIELDNQEPALLIKKAEIEILCRQGLQAQETAALAASLDKKNLSVQLDAARIYSDCGNHAGATRFLQCALDTDQKNPAVLFEHAKNQFYLGQMDAAGRSIAQFLESDTHAKGPLFLLQARLQKQTTQSNHIVALRAYLSMDRQEADTINSYYALAKELEDLGEFSDSFAALKSGADKMRQSLNFNLPGELQNLQGIETTFQVDAFAAIADSGSAAAPIFIVGMPRTGTTLVEHILTRHEGVISAGESSDFTAAMASVIDAYIAAHPDQGLGPLSAALQVDYNRIADQYMNNQIGMLGVADHYVDKLPFNYLYCGLIKKAFPNARILHMVRDPMDTCYAIYKTLFNQSYYFSYDLDELADYYSAYRQLMDHWHRLMPGAILDVQYESLVSDPVTVSKKIADYCGLDWSEDLLDVENKSKASSTASAAQIREPIYTTSVEKWRNFESELAPVFEKLKANGLLA
jgi:tetratricopeptide (TPR) repeat protein